LLQAFHKIINKHSGYKLNIYGQTSSQYARKKFEEWFFELTKKLKIQDDVILHGYKNREEITHILLEADILVSSRPYSQQAVYGFSTKLGEYLATGNPLVSTNFGEIGKYLSDKNNAFLCEPEPESLARAVAEAIENPELAEQVGKNGREYALLHFNNKFEIGKAMEFVNNV